MLWLTTHFCCVSQSSTACLDPWRLETKGCPPLVLHYVPPSSSSSSAASLLNHPPTNHLPDTPPQEPELIYCWMGQKVCWRTGAATDPGNELWHCPSLGWHCGTPLVQRQMEQGLPWYSLDQSWGLSRLPCLGECLFDWGLLGNCVLDGQDGGDWPGSQSRCRLSSCCYSKTQIYISYK